MSVKQPTASVDGSGNRFGTFSGVFTPSILTIFGLIMFMRANQVIGVSGIRASMIILTMASGITFLTGLSIGGISSNTPIKGGGAYFLISRVLGPGFGTAIGLALFLAQALSVPFYILGFIESVVATFPLLESAFLPLCLAVLGVLFIMAWIGAGWVIKLQYGILAILACAIIAFLAGAALNFDPAYFRANLSDNFDAQRGFWKMFALYFPAVTGIMAGVNMSGDLKNPGRSIPLGTLAAVIVGYLVYAAQILLCGGMAAREELIATPYLLLVNNALFGFGWLVTAGVFMATISSAIGSNLGAPRVLQAVGRDRALRILAPFARGTACGDEPRRALIATLLLGAGTLLLFGRGGAGAGLNMVAEIVTMVFLYTYGMTNLAAFVERFGGNPSFRPRFRFFHWSTALAGAIACVWVAFMINFIAALLALVFIAVLFVLVQRREMTAAYGDARRGFVYAQVSNNLAKLASMPIHPKNWRPTILVLSGNPHQRAALVLHARWLGQKSGIVSLLNVVVGRRETQMHEYEQAVRQLDQFRQEHDRTIFPEVVLVNDFDTDLAVILQSYSIGPIKPNIVLMGWPQNAQRLAPYFRHLQTIMDFGKSIVIYIAGQDAQDRQPQRIDIWWKGRRNGSLMIILAHLLTLNSVWCRCRLRLLRQVATPEDVAEDKQEMEWILHEARIQGDIQVAVSSEPFRQVLKKYSTDADLLILGLERLDENAQQAYFTNTEELLKQMPSAMLVYSSGEADLMA